MIELNWNVSGWNSEIVVSKVHKGGEVAPDKAVIEHAAEADRVWLKPSLTSSDEVMALLLTVDGLRRINPVIELILEIGYTPYGRQDRVFAGGEPLSLAVFSKLINSCNFSRVEICDPHSDVTQALIERSVVRSQMELFNQSRVDLPSTVRQAIGHALKCAPDAGAQKKFKGVDPLDYVVAMKRRNAEDMSIEEMTLSGDVEGYDVVVMDDICDGGRTFIALAETLKKAGAKDLYLYVTHGIFSYGTEELLKHYQHILTRSTFHFPGTEMHATLAANPNITII